MPCLRDFDCYWCDDNASCLESPKSCNLLSHQCPFPQCTGKSNCTQCLSEFGCNWCEDGQGQCQFSTSNCSLLVHSCASTTPSTRKFDAASFFGGGVLGAALFAVVGGVIFYMVYQRKKKYEPLLQ